MDAAHIEGIVGSTSMPMEVWKLFMVTGDGRSSGYGAQTRPSSREVDHIGIVLPAQDERFATRLLLLLYGFHWTKLQKWSVCHEQLDV